MIHRLLIAGMVTALVVPVTSGCSKKKKKTKKKTTVKKTKKRRIERRRVGLGREPLGGGKARQPAGKSLPKVGIPVCDEYTEALQCYLTKLPPSARRSSRRTYQNILRVWKRVPRARLESACKTAYTAWKKANAVRPGVKECIKADDPGGMAEPTPGVN